jgi:beta-aspartyl-peptidase (threonine type)
MIFNQTASNSALSRPVLALQGGAGTIPDELAPEHLAGMRAALAAGWRVLEAGGPALDAVEAAVVVMEDNDVFDAGRGSYLTSDGRVQLDALIMDGADLRAGGVGCVEHIRNPIRAARKILEVSPHVYFVGAGAEKFAAERGLDMCENSELIVPREVERLERLRKESSANSPKGGTVGAAALDRAGNLAAATSTGGTPNKTPGRVGDSSLIGCGCYADNLSAAVSTTGWGEPIMKLVLGKWAVDRVAEGNTPQQTASMAIEYLQQRLSGHGGIILLDPSGRVGIAHNTSHMAWAYRSAGEDMVGLRAS